MGGNWVKFTQESTLFLTTVSDSITSIITIFKMLLLSTHIKHYIHWEDIAPLSYLLVHEKILQGLNISRTKRLRYKIIIQEHAMGLL